MPATRIMSVRLPESLADRLTDAAERSGVSASAYIGQVLAKILPRSGESSFTPTAPLLCDYCTSRFDDEGARAAHVRRCPYSVACPRCHALTRTPCRSTNGREVAGPAHSHAGRKKMAARRIA